MSLAILDLAELYENIFRKPYHIDGFSKSDIKEDMLGSIRSESGKSLLKVKHLNKDIWMPTRFFELDKSKFTNGELFLPYATVNIANKKSIVRTSIAERKGTVKELYSMDDYTIIMNGFLLDDKYQQFPEAEILAFKKLYELNEAVKLDNALINLFLDKDAKVMLEEFEFVEVKGGKQKYQPFTLRISSDSVFTLEVE
jgi:hypothetical protein